MARRSQILIRVIVYAVALLSVVAGIPKVLQMPQELELLSAIGFSEVAVSLLGVVQLTGGILLIWPRIRLVGALFAGIALLTSSIAIFVSGNPVFGAISLLPFILALLVVNLEFRSLKRRAV